MGDKTLVICQKEDLLWWGKALLQSILFIAMRFQLIIKDRAKINQGIDFFINVQGDLHMYELTGHIQP
ncbi:hypothetical protein [Desulfosporosinus sp. SB140]|uniref:hypothetical protein n=1 Tax=Desulfosporosinus paludis TaxID=3115649 RepID=UPI003890E120